MDEKHGRFGIKPQDLLKSQNGGLKRLMVAKITQERFGGWKKSKERSKIIKERRRCSGVKMRN